MKEWIALSGLGAGLFTVALIGTLAVQGRLDYAGTRGVPIVSMLFSPPDGTDVTSEEATPDAQPVVDPEPPSSRSDPEMQAPAAQRDLETGGPGLFTFPQIDSGMTADDLDRILEAAHAAEEAARRDRARIDAREADLLARQRDLEDRESAIAAQMMRVDQERERLERRIAEFESKVLLVEQDELRGLREYGRTIGAFDPARAAAIVLEEWATDEGRKRITKVLAVMDPGDVDAVLARIDQERIREVLLERLKVVHEPRRR